jgi:prepilin-type N-terminal cleavage/methylation domain-containing protein
MKIPIVISRNHGITMIEVLIALVLTGLVTAAIMNTYVTQHENYLVQDMSPPCSKAREPVSMN